MVAVISFDMTASHWHNLKDDPVVPGKRGLPDQGPGHFKTVQVMRMAGQLHTPAEAAGILKVRESWLKTKAAARVIPCTFIGKHLRFSDDDIAEIMKSGARQPVTSRGLGSRRGTA
ncbi:MAG: helix-turn-helix domain-containing protein [Streptosporangiaceae bacterium]